MQRFEFCSTICWLSQSVSAKMRRHIFRADFLMESNGLGIYF